MMSVTQERRIERCRIYKQPLQCGAQSWGCRLGQLQCCSAECMCCAAAAVMGQSQNKPLRRQCLTAAESTEFRPCAVCIGIGGGSLPLFLAHHFPGMLVQAVELDPVVLAGASQAMGFPIDRCLTTATLGTDACACFLGTQGLVLPFCSNGEDM